jgi:hypothetical protein
MNAKRSVTVVEELDVPADFLWQTISDFEHIDRWADLKVRAIEGSGIGCQRTVEMESGALVMERLLVCDPAQMIFSYGIVAPNPYPMHDYQSTVRIEKISAQRSRLTWVGDYVPAEGTDPARSDNLLRKVYSGGIELLRRHFAQQKS